MKLQILRMKNQIMMLKKLKENDITFKIKTRADTDGHLRFYYPDDCTVEINGEETEIIKEDSESNTFLIRIPGDEKPLTVKVKKIRKSHE